MWQAISKKLEEVIKTKKYKNKRKERIIMFGSDSYYKKRRLEDD